MTGTTLDEILSDLEDLEGQERLQYLMELGDEVADFPREWQTEANRVLGCMSQVWVVPQASTEKSQGAALLQFRGTSDAALVRGLIAFLLAAYNEHTASEILSYPIEETIERAGLQNLIGMQRSSGLRSMIRRIRELAELAQESPLASIAKVPQTAAETAPKATPAAGQGILPISAPPAKGQPVDPTRLLDTDKIRQDFPILQRRFENGKPLIYFDNGASTQRPQAVLEAMRRVEENCYSNVHRGGHALAAETTQLFEQARTSAQHLLNARTRQEIIFTSGTTAAINLVAQSFGGAQLRSGDEILLTEMEHHSNIVPWQQIAERTGAVIRWAPLRDDFQLDLTAFASLLNSRTKIVAITAISNVLGTMTPLRTIISQAHAAGAKVLVDAAQAAPHEALDVQQLDCDFLAFSGHKLLGPTGIGVLYGKEKLLAAMPPFLGGGSMIHRVTREGFTAADLPHKFEAGTPPIVQAIGLGAAIDYLRNIGLTSIREHELQLTRRAHELLAPIPGLRILGPAPEEKGGIVTFVLAGVHPDDLSRLLDVQGIAVRAGHHCAMPLHERLGVSASCRASFYLYNTLQEVESFAAELVQIQKRFAR